MKMAITVLLFSLAAIAVEPNFVKTTTYGVGTNSSGVSQNMVTTEYSDGLGKNIQSKVSLSSTKDRVSCTFYDDAGRQKYVTKPFVDQTNPGSYLEGDSATINTSSLLQSSYSGTGNDAQYAFSSVDYYDDPLNRVKESGTPGAATRVGQGNTSKVWYFGVGLENKTIDNNDVGYSIYFVHGLLSMDPYNISSQIGSTLDALYESFLTSNPFSSPEYYLTITENPDGHFSEELKDIFGKTISTCVLKPIYQSSGVGTYGNASYSYDILGNVLSETPPTNDGTKLISNTTYQYNTLGQLIKKTTPDAGVLIYDYYDDGQIKTVTTKNFSEETTYRILNYTYDDLDRLTQITYTQPQTGITDATVLKNYYDDLRQVIADNIISIPATYYSTTDTANLQGKLVASVSYNIIKGINESVVDLYSYDDDGRIWRKYKKIPGMQIQDTRYEYDIHGKITGQRFKYNDDYSYKTFSYDELGRLKSLNHGNVGNDNMVNYTYTDIGQLTSKTLPKISNDYTQTYNYSIRDQLLNINPPSAKKGFYENISDYSYAGNIKQAEYKYIGSSTADFNLTYSYDYLNRLTSVTPAGTAYSATYSYDPAGRITNKTEGSSALTGYQYYNNASDQYTSRLQNVKKNNTVVKDYIYDVFGNLVVDLTKNMYIEYDYRNLPVAFRFYSNLSTIVSGTTTSNTGTADDNLFINIKNSGVMVSQVVMYYDASGNRVAKLESK